MSGSKYFVWAEDRWRELDVRSGRVEGWSRRPHFVFVQRNRLRVAARQRILSALDALASHRHSAVSVGPRLSARSIERGSKTRSKALMAPAAPAPLAPPAATACVHQHCCCVHSNSCNNKIITKASANLPNAPSQTLTIPPAQPQHTDAATEMSVDAATQNSTDAPSLNHSTKPLYINLLNHAKEIRPPDIRPQDIQPPEVRQTRIRPPEARPTQERSPEIRPTPSQHATSQVKRPVRDSGPRLDTLLKRATPLKRPRPDTQTSDSSDQFRKKPKRKSGGRSNRRASRRNSSLSKSASPARDNICKELVVSVTDIMAMRSYVARTRPGALERFDYDDGFKRELFYSINPLVDVARCPQTERALRERHEMALTQFAASLGLAPQGSTPPPPMRRRRAHANYREKSSSDNDKENRLEKDNIRSKNNKFAAGTKPRNKPIAQNNNSNNTPHKSGENRREFTRNTDAQATRKNNVRTTRNSEAQRQHKGDSSEKRDTSRTSNENKRDSLRSRTVPSIPNNGVASVPNSGNVDGSKRDGTTQFNYANRAVAAANNRSYKDTTSSSDESSSTEKDTSSESNQTNRTSSRPVITVESSSDTDSSSNSSDDRRTSLRSRTEVKAKEDTSNTGKDKENEKRTSPRKKPTIQANGTNESDSESANEFRAVRTRVSDARSVESGRSEVKASSSSGNSSKSVKKRVVVVKKSVSVKGKVTKPVRMAKPVREKSPQAHTSDSKANQDKKSTANGDKQIPTHVISKRASGNASKEYSNLEDHAIVSWVSAGARARLVNGNRLWRELQEAFPRIAGRERSWHSLRNRYLRYILPSLGALHLPPADVSRLRAAAATGEVKTKRAGGTAKSRRNSIFKESAVRAASARRPHARLDIEPVTPAPASAPAPAVASAPAPASSSSSSEEEEKPPARPQARRSLRARTSDVTPSPAPHSPVLHDKPAPTGPPRSRKLFNPKLVL